jgi:hypothetical protein
MRFPKPSLFIFLALPALFWGMEACEPCGKGYEGPGMLKGILVSPMDKNQQLESGDTIYADNDSAFFRLEYETGRLVMKTGFSLFPAAYACSPPEPYFANWIDSMRIVAIDDWGVDFPAGSSLNVNTEVVSASAAGRYMQHEFFNSYLVEIRYSKHMANAYPAICRFFRMPESGTGSFYIAAYMDNGLEFRSRVMTVKSR